MALLNIFKKKSGDEKPKAQGVKPSVESVAPKFKKILGQAHRAIRGPHVTEKATDLTSKNQYVFEVFHDSNKNMVKKAVEDVYGVDVTDVNVVNIPRKRRRLGGREGWKGGYKKAIVKIKEGQKIEVLPR